MNCNFSDFFEPCPVEGQFLILSMIAFERGGFTHDKNINTVACAAHVGELLNTAIFNRTPEHRYWIVEPV